LCYENPAETYRKSGAAPDILRGYLVVNGVN
jgi:hypothetical protein